MKSKTMILMGVAVVCGLGASYMTSRLLAERNETVTVLIPKQKYTQWTHIKDPATMFVEKELPKHEAPKTAVFAFDDLKDRILLRSLPEGQPVVQEDLQPKDKGSLDAQLPPGKRAVAIKTEASKAVGGFVLPGSRVDVLHAFRRLDTNEAKMVLQNVLVRAVDLQSVKPEDKQGFVPSTVTLEVTPQEALTLAQVQDTGSLILSLRSVGDTSVVSAGEMTTVPPPPPKLPPPPPPPPPVIVKAAPKVEPPPVKVVRVDRKTMTIYNGLHGKQWGFVSRDGAMTTEELWSSQDDPAISKAAPTPVAAAVPAPGRSHEEIVDRAEKDLRTAEKDLGFLKSLFGASQEKR